MIENIEFKNVLSLFDGISGFQVALERAGIQVSNYYASEIDKYAISITQKNYQNTIQKGDIKNIYSKDLPKIDLICGGSPCQDLSIAKQGREGLKGARSGLFWHYVRLVRTCKPKVFILENVHSMKKSEVEIISRELKVKPVMINSALLTAQNRKRWYWVGGYKDGKVYQVFIPQPQDKGILLKDILEDNVEKKYHLSEKAKKYITSSGTKGYKLTNQEFNPPKAFSLTCKSFGTHRLGIDTYIKIKHIPHGFVKEKITENKKYPTLCGQDPSSKHKIIDGDIIRKLTPIECERLQGYIDNFSEFGIDINGNLVKISNTRRYMTLGNSFSPDVVAWILMNIG